MDKFGSTLYEQPKSIENGDIGSFFATLKKIAGVSIAATVGSMFLSSCANQPEIKNFTDAKNPIIEESKNSIKTILNDTNDKFLGRLVENKNGELDVYVNYDKIAKISKKLSLESNLYEKIIEANEIGSLQYDSYFDKISDTLKENNKLGELAGDYASYESIKNSNSGKIEELKIFLHFTLNKLNGEYKNYGLSQSIIKESENTLFVGLNKSGKATIELFLNYVSNKAADKNVIDKMHSNMNSFIVSFKKSSDDLLKDSIKELNFGYKEISFSDIKNNTSNYIAQNNTSTNKEPS